jgi:hypothetical protein
MFDMNARTEVMTEWKISPDNHRDRRCPGVRPEITTEEDEDEQG